MTHKEKRLLRFALIIFIGIVLPFQLAPKAYDFYHNYRQSIDQLHRDIELYKKLGKQAELWETESQRALQERNKINAGLLEGKNRQLVGLKMESLVKQIAQQAGIKFKTLDPADTAYSTHEWLLVIQTMQFEATSETLIAFLKALQNTKENLVVSTLDLRSFRNKLSGTIKITGFSRLPPPSDEE
ncbi:MAG: hypothetical protein VSS75_018070 [Candidatus Parabeggiatoa sp.]|nr:hypothetical protein [Candidatus Parabeggiatoa sp.]